MLHYRQPGQGDTLYVKHAIVIWAKSIRIQCNSCPLSKITFVTIKTYNNMSVGLVNWLR